MVRYLEQNVREKLFSSREDNLKGPLLALLQPRATPRVKEKETVEIAFNGQQKADGLGEISVE